MTNRSQIFASDQNIAFGNLFRPAGLKAFHAVFAQLFRICGYQEARRNDGIRINMIPDLVNLALVFHLNVLKSCPARQHGRQLR